MLCLPSTCPNISASLIQVRLLTVGSKSTLLPGVTLVDSHEIKKEVSVAECNVVTKKGLSRQHEPLQDLY